MPALSAFKAAAGVILVPPPSGGDIAVAELDSGKASVNSDTLTMNSFTPTANVLVLISISYGSAAPDGGWTPTIGTSNGTDWVLVAVQNQTAGGEERTAVFRGMASSPVAAAPVATFGANQRAWMWTVHELTNVDTTGTFGSGAVVQSDGAQTLGGTSIETVLAAFGDATNNVAWLTTGESVNDNAIFTHTPAGSLIEIFDDWLSRADTFGISANWQKGEDLSPGNSVTKTNNIGAVAIEIKKAA